MTQPFRPTKVFPVPYQVDFTADNKGRHLDSTKRKLTWKFGFANPPTIFPHFFDKDENYIGDSVDDSNTSVNDHEGDVPHKKGAECRGREHEIILVWSLLTNKAHIYVNSQEIFRLDSPHDDFLNLNPFSGSFHRGFNLPNPKYNGNHRIDIRCYARTPIGAKNMIVDDAGGKFRQYDLTVDGISFFNMPVMYELGTSSMWNKLSRWGMMRSDSHDEGTHEVERQHFTGNNNNMTGRLQDEHYFVKSNRSITKSDRRAMAPRSESDEQRMMRIAMQASLRDLDNEDHACSYSGKGSKLLLRSSSSEENNAEFGNMRSSSQRSAKGNKSSNLVTVGEDENLIDFGADDTLGAGALVNGLSQITISRPSDVSVLADDDATTTSFMMRPGWNNPAGQSFMPVYAPNFQPQYRDPTYAQPQRPWNSVGTISSNQPGVNTRPVLSSEMSFVVPPAPTWDDYNNAFGGSTMSIATPNPLSPASTIGMHSPTAPSGNWQSQPRAGAPAAPPVNRSMFDPLRADPFATY